MGAKFESLCLNELQRLGPLVMWICLSDKFVKIYGERNWVLGFGVDGPGGAPFFKDFCQYGRFLLVPCFT